MTDWRYDVAIAFAVAEVTLWIVMAFCAVRISHELLRARRAGEASQIPLGARGLPLTVIFAKDALPRVERERQVLVVCFVLFASLWFIMAVSVAVFGPLHY
jgi:hypothetical protein